MTSTTWLLFVGGFGIGVLVTLAAGLLMLWLHARAMEADLEFEQLTAAGWRPPSMTQSPGKPPLPVVAKPTLPTLPAAGLTPGRHVPERYAIDMLASDGTGGRHSMLPPERRSVPNSRHDRGSPSYPHDPYDCW